MFFCMYDYTQTRIRRVQPSAKREGFATTPDITWEDVGALADPRRCCVNIASWIMRVMALLLLQEYPYSDYLNQHSHITIVFIAHMAVRIILAHTNPYRELEEAITFPLVNPDLCRKLGIESPPGVLLYGPPGCGKTLLAKAVANGSSANFISIKGPELLNKFVGESEAAVRRVRRALHRVASCCVVFNCTALPY